MRVIAGSAKGRRLKSPRGSGIRPTSDLLKEAMFNILDAAGTDYSRVLDLYAGSGALGIEALSRGDGTGDFVEQDASACSLIRENLSATGFEARARVHRMTAAAAANRLEGAYTLVLADPPYADDAAVATLEALASSPLVDDNGVLMLEHSKRRDPPEKLGRLHLSQTRRHGDSVISIYRREV